MEDDASAGRPGSLAGLRDASDPIEGFGEDFSALYRRRFSEMVHLASFITGRPEVAPDLVHDAFIRVHVSWARVRDPDAYLRRAVVNASRSHLRRVVRYRSALARQDRVAPTTSAATAGNDDLVEALRRLPRRQSAALALRFYLDLPDRDIAEILHCRPGTVASLVHRGLAALKEVIDP